MEEKKERPKRTVKPTSVVMDNVELDKLMKKAVKPDKKPPTAAEKRRAEKNKRDLSAERKKAADDVEAFKAIKEAADEELLKKKKIAEDKKLKIAEDKKKRDEEKRIKKLEEDKKKKLEDERKKAMEEEKKKKRNTDVPKPSPKCKKPTASKVAKDDEKPEDKDGKRPAERKVGFTKPSPKSKKPIGYKDDENDDKPDDKEVKRRGSRKALFPKKVVDVTELKVPEESCSQPVEVAKELIGEKSTDSDSTDSTDSGNNQPDMFTGVKSALETAAKEAVPKTDLPKYQSIKDVDAVLNAAKKAKAELLSKSITNKLDILQEDLKKIDTKGEEIHDFDTIQTQVDEARRIIGEENAKDKQDLTVMEEVEESTQQLENELNELKERLRLIKTKQDFEMEDTTNKVTHSFTRFLKLSEAYKGQNLEDIEREYKKNFRKFLTSEQKARKEAKATEKEKEVVQYEVEPFKETFLHTMLKVLETIIPEAKGIAEAAIKHSLDYYNYRRGQIEDHNKQAMAKFHKEDTKEKSDRTKLLDYMINLQDEIAAWNETTLQENSHCVEGDILEPLQESKNKLTEMLSEDWALDPTLTPKAIKLKEIHQVFNDTKAKVSDAIKVSNRNEEIARKVRGYTKESLERKIPELIAQQENQIQTLADWQKEKYTNRLPHLTELEQGENNILTDIIDRTREGIALMSKKKNFPIVAFEKQIEAFKEFTETIQAKFEHDLRQRQRLQLQREVALDKCITNAMLHLEFEQNIPDVGRYKWAVSNFMREKLMPSEIPVEEGEKTALEVASLELSDLLAEDFAEESKNIFNEITKYLDHKKHYEPVVKIVAHSPERMEEDTNVEGKSMSPSKKRTSSNSSHDSRTSSHTSLSSEVRWVTRTPTPTPELASTNELAGKKEEEEKHESDVDLMFADDDREEIEDDLTKEKEKESTKEKEGEDDKEDTNKSSGSNTEDEDAYIKAGMKARAAKNRALKRTKKDMLDDLISGKTKPDDSKDTKTKDDKKRKRVVIDDTAKPSVIDKMAKKVKAMKDLVTRKKKAHSDSEEDLTPDSGEDKEWKPSKKDGDNSSDDFKKDEPKKKKSLITHGSSDDFKTDDTKERKKILTKKKSKAKVAIDPSDKDGKEKRFLARPRRPNVVRQDFEALGYDLATPTSVSKDSKLTWEEVNDIVFDADEPHGGMKSYFEPKKNEVYKIKNVLARKEDANVFAHRDKYYAVAHGGAQKKGNMQRIKYKTKMVDGSWSAESFVKFIYTIPDQDVILLQYVGDPAVAMEKPEPLKPAPKKPRLDGPSSDEDGLPTKEGENRHGVIDPSDMEATDAGEDEDSAEDERTETQKELALSQAREESDRRKVEKMTNNLAKFFQAVKEKKDWEPSQRALHIAMNKKREAQEAFVLENEDELITNRELDAVINEALRIGEGIENGNETYISVPEGGKVYLFDCRKTQLPWTKMLLNDGYRYKNKNHYYLPNSNFDKTKYYGFKYDPEQKKLVPTPTFKKYTYFNTQSGILAIHYRGNVKDLTRVPHGNSKKSKQDFIPTTKALEEDIKVKYAERSRYEAYHGLTSKLPGGVASSVVGPRNPRAVGYLMNKEEKQSWVNRIDEFKAVSLASDYLGDFVRGSTMHQYYAATLATEASLTELKKVIYNLPKDKVLEWYYDTTFEFGDHYCSIASYRHPLLERINKNSYSKDDRPIVPAFYMIHQKKLQQSHEYMLRTAEESYDRKFVHARKTLGNTPKAFVTDKEFYGAKLLSNCKTIHCWNHLKQNIRNEAKYKKHVREKDIEKIQADFDLLIVSKSVESYTKRRDEMLEKTHWKNTGMADYYMRKVDEDFRENSARWVLEEYGIGNGHFGITNNPAETVNSVIHTLKDREQLRLRHKDFTVPDTMFFFHHYAQCNDKEIQSAYFGASTNFQVREEYRHKFKKDLAMMPPVHIMSVQELKDDLREMLDPKHDPIESETPAKIKPPKDDVNPYEKIADYLVQSDRITKVPLMRMYFAVRDTATEKLVWVDYMNNNCTCPIGKDTACPHKLAVRKKYDLPNPTGKGDKTHLDKSLAFHPALKKRPRYGSKKPTTDDTHDIAVHGMKKDKAADVRRMKKDVKDEYEMAEDENKSASDENKSASDEDAMIIGGFRRVGDMTVTWKENTNKPKDPKTNFICTSIDIQSVTTDLNPDDVTVMPYTAKVFNMDSKEKFAIFRPNENHAVLLYKKEDDKFMQRVDTLKFAALSTRRGATMQVRTKNKPMAAISYRLVKDNIDLQTAAKQLHKEKNWDLKGDVHVELGCYCRQPFTVTESKDNIAKCSDCSSNYHISCLDDTDKSKLQDVGKKWSCKPCKIPRNIEWSHNNVCINTCTVDPFFQTVYLSICQDKNLLKNFPNDEPHNILKEALLDIENRKCYEAHLKWYELVKKTKPEAFHFPDEEGNFWGNDHEVGYKMVGSGKQLIRILTCSNDNCPQTVTVSEKADTMYLRANEGPLSEQIDNMLGNRKNKGKCNNCNIGKVTGGEVHFSTADKVWFVEFRGSGWHDERDKIHEKLLSGLKSEIEIPDSDGQKHVFKLKTITMSQQNRKHFVSIHKIDDSFVHADHMYERTRDVGDDEKDDGKKKEKTTKDFPRRYRAPLPSDYDFYGPHKASISTVIYVRDFSDK